MMKMFLILSPLHVPGHYTYFLTALKREGLVIKSHIATLKELYVALGERRKKNTQVYIIDAYSQGLSHFPSPPLSATYTYIFSLPNLLQLVSLLFLQAFISPSLKPSVA